MSKILEYELRRLILNKFFIGLLVINCFYAWYILISDIIAGVAYTAPFSPWSFGTYLAKVMPIVILTILFLLTFYYSKKEKQVEVLTTATPVNPVHYLLIRCCAIAVCFFIIYILIIGLGLYFYISFFDYRNFASFILPTLMILLPCFVFVLGIGSLAGRIHSGLLYTMMLITLVAGFTNIYGEFDFFCGGYLSTYPISLPLEADGEPAFVISIGFLMARLFYLTMGGLLFAICISASQQKARKA